MSMSKRALLIKRERSWHLWWTGHCRRLLDRISR